MHYSSEDTRDKAVSAGGSLNEMHRLCWVALMAALVAAGALFHLSIGPVPITFQEFFIVLSGLLLGPRHGVYVVILYIFAGAAGLPVFSGGRAGLGHLVGPTAGYFVGFLMLALCAGIGAQTAKKLHAGPRKDADGEQENKSFAQLGRGPTLVALGFSVVGLFFLYCCGVAWLMYSLDFTVGQAISAGVLPFLPLATVKLVLAVLVWRGLYAKRLLPLWN